MKIIASGSPVNVVMTPYESLIPIYRGTQRVKRHEPAVYNPGIPGWDAWLV